MIALIEKVAGRKITPAQIETGCERYEKASAVLEQLIADLELDLAAVKQKHLRAIKKQAAEVAACQAELGSLVESAPELFTKPRTITVHGIKVGFILSAGRLEFDDEATVISLIKKLRKDDADLFIRSTDEVNKDALKTLTPAELKKLGCWIEGAGDMVVLKRVAGEVEKLINKLIAKLVEGMVAAPPTNL
ncbi:MAG: host-nuclease inhibitor Gam family protein [Patescibacteria group bacterium]|nr:host-nuclease inhibitor Gam family protein [Patescibacteria group bacterium]